MKLKTPKAIVHGHENLIEEFKDIMNIGGRIGEKAKVLNNIMTPHFKKEEEYALPPLGLLLTLSEGNWEIAPEEAIKMADNLQSKLAEMTQDHANISSILYELKLIADEENSLITKHFVKNLTLHMELEDEVLYPTTILIGNYLKKISTL